jgi:Skp family chaperone for outer membrane proteins
VETVLALEPHAASEAKVAAASASTVDACSELQRLVYSVRSRKRAAGGPVISRFCRCTGVMLRAEAIINFLQKTLKMKEKLLILMLLTLTSACTSTYYKALETVGIEKRDVLVDRIDDARDAQDDAKEEFTSALDRYRELVTVDGGDLEKTYDRLNTAYERSAREAEEVSDRIDAVEEVADDLFEEWEMEIREYSDPDLRRQSEQLLRETRNDYGDVIAAMRRAEASMDPVLTLFNDQVLFLRHNLNARAIASLDSELASIEQATDSLIRDMETAIAEANRFIDSMG